jgi:tetratricopeptide (TPR) repeat protein
MARLRSAHFCIVFATSLAIFPTTKALAQSIESHTTVRHHREVVEEQPDEIAKAEDAIQNKDFAAAEALLRKAVARDPENKEKWAYQAWFDLGFVLNRLGRADESIAAYRKSVEARSDIFDSNLNLGLMLEHTHNPEAEKYFRAATTLTPAAHVEESQARAWLSLGHATENRDPAQALQAYAKAAELTPTDPEPHLCAGLLDERQKDFTAAEAEYKKVLAIDTHSTDAVIGLTNIYMKSGRLADAEPLLRRLAADRPSDGGLHLQLGRVLVGEKKNDDAMVEFQAALKVSPKDPDAQRELADLYASAGKNDLAEVAYRPLVAASPNDPELHRSLGRALLLQKKFPEAQQEFLVAVRLKRDSPDAYVDLAFAASENKNYDLAVRALNGRAMLNADMPALCFFWRASAYDHLGDWKQASSDYHSFLDAANGKYPDQEWQARHRLVTIEPKRH